MKKRILWTLITAGLLLLVSCKPSNGAGPIEMPTNHNTPTPIVVPTCTPTASPSPDPALHPTAAPTAEPTKEALPSPTEAPTATPEPTVTPSPVPTATPTPSPSPTPGPSPTPTINPELLVSNGWQRTISIDEEYVIIFPELYNESTISKTDRELKVCYTCKTNENIAFEINYSMQQKLGDTVMDILAANGIVFDEVPGQKRISYRWRLGDTMYRGILLEAQYPQSLLGTSFGEEEWITGVMQVVFSYPAEQDEIYEAEEYSYYVIENREE